MDLHMINRRLLIVVAVILIAGCSDDKTTGPEMSDIAAPLVVKVVYPYGPMSKCGNYFAGQAAEYISAATDYLEVFDPPDMAGCVSAGIRADDSVSYSWEIVDITVTMDRKETSAGYHWWIFYDGTDGDIIYNDCKIIEAEQAADESEGWMELYTDFSGNDTTHWEWTKNDDGDITMNMNWFDNDLNTYELEAVFRSGGDGYAQHSRNGTPVWKVTWIKSGSESSGEWFDYISQPNISGTWTY
nr:hypothetical protein [candidate division Zixibacteria bacterium]